MSGNISAINEILDKYEEGDELEIRVGSFNDYFKASIEKDIFLKFINHFKTNTDYKLTSKKQIIWFYNNRIKKIYDLDTKISYYVKKRLKQLLDMRNNNIRIALNKEIILTENDNENYQYTTKRLRNSYVKKDNTLKIDMSIDINLSNKEIYYIEFEFLKKPTYEYIMYVLEMIKNINKF